MNLHILFEFLLEVLHRCFKIRSLIDKLLLDINIAISLFVSILDIIIIELKDMLLELFVVSND